MAGGVRVAGEDVWHGGRAWPGVCAWWGGLQSMRGGTHPTGMHSCFFFIIASTE